MAAGYNPNRDEKGQFSSSGTSGGGKVSSNDGQKGGAADLASIHAEKLAKIADHTMERKTIRDIKAGRETANYTASRAHEKAAKLHDKIANKSKNENVKSYHGGAAEYHYQKSDHYKQLDSY